MKKSIGAHTIVHPLPVFVVGSYDKLKQPNMMVASWGGICCSKPPCIAISLREATMSYHNILDSQAFTVAIPSEKHVKEVDFIGIVSGKNVNKFEKTGFHAIQSKHVNAPIIEELAYTLECKLVRHITLGLHTQFIGEIVNIEADDSILNDKNFPDIEKVKPFFFASFGNQEYYSIGKPCGEAFSIGRQLGSNE